MRWGIETSFRELKYAIGLTSFHARKPDFIKQEIYARLLLNITVQMYPCSEGTDTGNPVL